MFVIRHKKIFFSIGILMVIVSIVLVAVDGLKFGIDFTGGTIVEVSYPEGERPAKRDVEASLAEVLSGPAPVVQEFGEEGYVLRTRFLEEDERQVVTDAFSVAGEEVEVERFNSIGPAVSGELGKKAVVAILVVVVAIILFIAFTFRKVSEPVSSWKYGVVAVVALIHDIIIPTGLFALLGTFLVSAEIDLLFVTALLAILGFSVNDTIVVFDRVRENLAINREKHIKEPFEKTVGKSLAQTYGRSINTSLTTVLVLLALFFLGAESTKMFALVLMVGMIAGTYSSIFLASPLLVKLNDWSKK